MEMRIWATRDLLAFAALSIVEELDRIGLLLRLIEGRTGPHRLIVIFCLLEDDCKLGSFRVFSSDCPTEACEGVFQINRIRPKPLQADPLWGSTKGPSASMSLPSKTVSRLPTHNDL